MRWTVPTTNVILAGIPQLCLVIIGTFGFVGSRAEDIDRWYLMSRHGDCAEISTLARKLPDLPSLNSPASFSRYVQEQGHNVSEQPLNIPNGEAVQIDVPALSLNLIFVEELCEGYAAHD